MGVWYTEPIDKILLYMNLKHHKNKIKTENVEEIQTFTSPVFLFLGLKCSVIEF